MLRLDSSCTDGGRVCGETRANYQLYALLLIFPDLNRGSNSGTLRYCQCHEKDLATRGGGTYRLAYTH